MSIIRLLFVCVCVFVCLFVYLLFLCMVHRLLQNLLINAKLRFAESGDSPGVELCDT